MRLLLLVSYSFVKKIPLLFLPLFLIACSPIAVVEKAEQTIILKAARIFDGHQLKTNSSILIKDGMIEKIGDFQSFNNANARVIDLGDATILPGFIELHAHLTFQKVPADIVLKHGITTIRDLGGPIHKPYGGNGSLRVLTSGSIITAPNGYPIPIFGNNSHAIAVITEVQARRTVAKLVESGAVIIKIALEPGGETGAPWSSGHGHGNKHGHKHNKHNADQQWPLLSEKIVTAIVDEAHKLNRKVIAHIGEAKGAEIAINSGVDEWAHMPCATIPEHLLKKAVEQGVTVISTIDTLSKCTGIIQNTKLLASLGAKILYGAETAHPDIPWGIDAQELLYLMRYADMSVIEVLKAVTSKAGQQLNYPLLGTIQAGAPADIISVKGNPLDKLKKLEYPDLVISGGKIIVNNF